MWAFCREVLQLCSYPVVGSPDAPPGVFGLRSIQMASIRAGGHPHGSGMVFAILAFVPRRRGAIGRAWALGGSRHRLALGRWRSKATVQRGPKFVSMLSALRTQSEAHDK
jgi:hypothetical protein